MAEIKKYLPYALVLFGFLLGFLISPKPDPEVERLNKKEQARLQNEIKVKEARVIELTKAGQEIVLKAEQDSIRFAGRLKAQEITIQKLKIKVDEVNYKNYSSADLDSVRAIILRAR